MLVPEEYGGASVSGCGLVEAAIISEELGRMVHPGPFQATNVVAAAIAEFGSDDQRQEYLPSIASGQTMATWAYLEPDGDWNPGRLSASGDSGRLRIRPERSEDVCTGRGLGGRVSWLPAATSTGPAQFLVPASAPRCFHRATRVHGSGPPPVRGELHRRPCRRRRRTRTRSAGPRSAIERQMQVALVLQCAETNGATEQGLALTVQYSKDRVAFGRPIGSYQALKHRMAEHRMWLEASFATTSYASHSVLGRRDDAPAAVRIAKAHVGKWSTAILHDCIQLHGGIGMTWDYDLHLYFRRTIGNEVLYGSPIRTDTVSRRHRRGGGLMAAVSTAVPTLDEFRLKVRSWLDGARTPQGTAGEPFLQWDDDGVARSRRIQRALWEGGITGITVPGRVRRAGARLPLTKRPFGRRRPLTGCPRSSATPSTSCCPRCWPTPARS